jgi:uncharacterized membrane protein (DUF4010 family)
MVAYWSTMHRQGTTADGTTEVVAVLVVALGVACGLGHRTPAAAAAAIAVVLLAEKSRVQQTLQRVDAHEMRAAVQFAVLALVILPLLPDAAYGPYDAFRPRQLWVVVLVFSALNFAGYIARRLIGETRGLGVTGLLGGVVSSTAVTLTFSRRSLLRPHRSRPVGQAHVGCAGLRYTSDRSCGARPYARDLALLVATRLARPPYIGCRLWHGCDGL